jgi:hypothetical protein
MSKDSLRQWDTAAANNTDIGGTDISGTTGKVKDGDNAIRAIMAQLAQSSDEMSYPTAGGSADALTLTPATASAAYASNDVWTFKAASSNTTAATLNISGLGAKAIRKMFGGSDIALVAGDIAAGVRYKVVYDSSANSAAGAWIIVSGNASLASTTEALTGTDAIKPVTSDALYALWGKGIDVASASTLTLGEGGLFNITGTTTITDIDFAVPADGRKATLIFEGDLTLTHNGTTLRLPGLANIPVKAGDRCDIVQDDADNIFVTNYTPAAARPYLQTTPSLVITQGVVPTVTNVKQTAVRIGNLVTVSYVGTFTSAGTGGQAITVSGLPYTADVAGTGSLCPGSGYFFDNGTQNYILSGVFDGAGTSITFISNASSNSFGISPGVTIANNDRLSFTFTYVAV